MTQIAYSELTKRFYFLPMKGQKIDITSDIKEIIDVYTKPLKEELFKFKKPAKRELYNPQPGELGTNK